MALKGVNPWQAFGAPRLDHTEFEALGREQGYIISWEKAIYCPRRIDNSLDKHDFNCPVCESRFGIIYFDKKLVDPNGDDLRALVTGIPQQQQYRVEGFFDAGSAYVSLPPGYTPSYGDRITLLKSRMRVSQVIKRGLGPVDRLKYAAIPGAEGGVVYCVDGQKNDHTSAVRIDKNGNLEWLASSGPSSGSYYSVMYYRRPVYLIVDLPHVIRDSLERQGGNDVTQDLGTQALARLDFLIRDESLGA